MAKNNSFSKIFTKLYQMSRKDEAYCAVDKKKMNKLIIFEQKVIYPITLKYKLRQKYILCLNYENNFHPRTWIVEPNNLEKMVQEKLGETSIPHVYSPGNSLCLYHPIDYSFFSDYDIEVIIDRVHQWLFYFEDFIITGKWYGLEASHEKDQPSSENNSNSINPKYLQDTPVRLGEDKKLIL